MTPPKKCCPTCGQLMPSARASMGGKARASQMWSVMTPEQRSAEMSRRRKKGMKDSAMAKDA